MGSPGADPQGRLYLKIISRNEGFVEAMMPSTATARDDIKKFVDEAVARRGFCPRVVFPEEKMDDKQLARLFERPLFVWIPEYQNGKGVPSCINPSCHCKPGVKDYGRRVVELSSASVICCS
ncbi:hypothetical protein V7S43_009208 [Phytophthora oleae]|uniref:Uncharacterized protein n=1 Tax=Phytophthora oleae TaxID=2107226 RepID=A0ABD3FL92_9STRA